MCKKVEFSSLRTHCHLLQLVKFHDAFTDRSKLTLVLEFMNAGSLAVRLLMFSVYFMGERLKF